MSKTAGSTPGPLPPEGSQISWEAELSELGERFAEYRRTRRGLSNVPQQLRDAVVAATRQGIAPSALQATCGVTRTQLNRWTAAAARASGHSKRSAAGAGTATDVRVLDVADAAAAREAPGCVAAPPVARVDSTPSTALPMTGAAAPAALPPQELELRLGPWCVSIRLAGDTAGSPAQGGRPCCP